MKGGQSSSGTEQWAIKRTTSALERVSLDFVTDKKEET